MAERLAAIPEVLERHTITGTGDMLGRVVARGQRRLAAVIDRIVATDGVVRTATMTATWPAWTRTCSTSGTSGSPPGCA